MSCLVCRLLQITSLSFARVSGSIFSHILDFNFTTVLIFILIYFKWRSSWKSARNRLVKGERFLIELDIKYEFTRVNKVINYPLKLV